MLVLCRKQKKPRCVVVIARLSGFVAYAIPYFALLDSSESEDKKPPSRISRFNDSDLKRRRRGRTLVQKNLRDRRRESKELICTSECVTEISLSLSRARVRAPSSNEEAAAGSSGRFLIPRRVEIARRAGRTIGNSLVALRRMCNDLAGAIFIGGGSRIIARNFNRGKTTRARARRCVEPACLRR